MVYIDMKGLNGTYEQYLQAEEDVNVKRTVREKEARSGLRHATFTWLFRSDMQ